MKLYISILATSLMITASMQAMEQSETAPLNPQVIPTQQLPKDCIPAGGLIVNKQEEIHQQAFKFKQQTAQLKAAKASQDRKACCLTGLAAFCCCPCLVLECIRDSICPTIVIVNQTPPNNNK